MIIMSLEIQHLNSLRSVVSTITWAKFTAIDRCAERVILRLINKQLDFWPYFWDDKYLDIIFRLSPFEFVVP